MQKFLRNIIPTIKPLAEKYHVGNYLRQSYVDILLTGERIQNVLGKRIKSNSNIFVAGSARSGTTWLTDILTSIPGTQQIFEPIFPPWNRQVQHLLKRRNRDFLDKLLLDLIYVPKDSEDEDWFKIWNTIFDGKMRNYWTDYERTSFFPDRYLVKEVRAQLMLGFILKKFSPQLIYIARHPCAVTYSRLINGFTTDVKYILNQEELVENYLRPWIKDIEREKDPVGAFSVLWAVENYVASCEISNINSFFVNYESIILNPIEVIKKLLNWLEFGFLSPEANKKIYEPSRMIGRSRDNNLGKFQISQWKNKLSIEDQNRIINWAKRLNINWYNESPLPIRNY